MFGTQVDRKRRAKCPRVTVNKQWAQDEGSTCVMKSWFHAAAMREIWDAYKAKTDGVFGLHKTWSRTARMFLTAKVFPETHPSVHAHSDNDIDEFDLKMAERTKAPKLMKKDQWWSPQRTLPLSANARYKERTGKEFHQFGEEPMQFRKYYSELRPSDTSEEEEGWGVS